jgi:hypothetical protein
MVDSAVGIERLSRHRGIIRVCSRWQSPAKDQLPCRRPAPGIRLTSTRTSRLAIPRTLLERDRCITATPAPGIPTTHATCRWRRGSRPSQPSWRAVSYAFGAAGPPREKILPKVDLSPSN